jgi:CDP-6-deoxy-D-xylo-4-hexulose-3-dehydrase
LYAAHHRSTISGGLCCTNIPEVKDLFMSFATWGRNCVCKGSANMLSCGSCGHRFDNWLPNYDGIIDHKYVFSEMGYNLQVIDLQGAIGNIQLTKFEEIDKNRKNSKNIIEKILLRYVNGIRGINELDSADICPFGIAFICENKILKTKLVTFLENNLIQTRNYFAGNLLLHPGYEHLDDFRKYTNSKRVLY